MNSWWCVGYTDAKLNNKFITPFKDIETSLNGEIYKARNDYHEGYEYYKWVQRQLNSFSIDISPRGLQSEYHDLISLPQLDYV